MTVVQAENKPDKAALRTLYQSLRPAYETALQELQQKVRQLLEQHGFSPAIKARLKRFEAYFDKRQRQARGERVYTREGLTDFLGLRIICPFLADIEAVTRLLASHFEVIEVEHKAAQHSFREFGYDSVHLLIPVPSNHLGLTMPGTEAVCEIQLRTILQDAWAEVEHELIYKSDIAMPNESIRRKLASLNATLTLSDLIFQELRDFQEEVRHRGRRRRETVNGVWQDNLRCRWQTDAGMEPPPGRLGPVPAALTNELEKLMLMALEAHSNHDFETAIELYGKLLGLKLEKHVRALVYNHRGMAYFASGETRLAVKDFSRALDFDPANIRGHLNRGLCYRVLQRFDEALADFDRALELDEDLVDALFGRAQCYHEMALYDRALTDCGEVLQRKPDHQPAEQLRRLIHRTMM